MHIIAVMDTIYYIDNDQHKALMQIYCRIELLYLYSLVTIASFIVITRIVVNVATTIQNNLTSNRYTKVL